VPDIADGARVQAPLHRCLKRHGSSRLPKVERDKQAKRAFKA